MDIAYQPAFPPTVGLSAVFCGGQPAPGYARVAAFVRFLVSEGAAHITGQVLPTDGGLSATLPKGR